MKRILVFSSPTCAPCKALRPVLDQEAAKRGFEYRYVEMAMVNQAEFVAHDIRTVPTIVCFDDGVEIGRLTGAQTPTGLQASLTAWGF